MHIIALDVDWSLNILLNSHLAAHQLEKSEN